jgi:hypothetical protein
MVTAFGLEQANPEHLALIAYRLGVNTAVI